MFFTRLVPVLITAIDFHLLRWWREYAAVVGTLIVLLLGTYFIFFSPPRAFPTGTVVTIPAGASLSRVAQILYEEKIVAYPTLFNAIVRITGGAHGIRAGGYRFAEPADLLVVARRLARGDSGIPRVRVTFPEGSSNRVMSRTIEEVLPLVSAEDFLAAAKAHEGYLFPETYYFDVSLRADDIVSVMRAHFDTQITSIEVAAGTRSLSDIVKMASLLEGEANTETDRKIVAGILWKRIALSMPLQVDAVFGYIKGESGYAPTLDDLKIDSPYNTYLYRGLPPTPINNPGLAALTAAANPALSPYLYYLTGKDGKMHYAKTFTEHQTNREKYLK